MILIYVSISLFRGNYGNIFDHLLFLLFEELSNLFLEGLLLFLAHTTHLTENLRKISRIDW